MSDKQRVIILGSTGSIGTTALRVARDFPERFEITGLAARSSNEKLATQAQEFQPSACALTHPASDKDLHDLREATKNHRCDILSGPESLTQLVETVEADMLVVATVGIAGLEPTLAGIEKQMRLALANKEVLVVGGQLVMQRAHDAGIEVIPIDSEHSALAQCLSGADISQVERLILTASGGPFRDARRSDIESATPAEALSHPTWDMGRKITIDSATLMNKGFEVIEACHLFGVTPRNIDVVIHPQSAIHSLVEFVDGSILAQLGPTEMYLPVLTAMAWPQRVANRMERLSLTNLGELTFSPPDTDRFPCLDYAREAITTGSLMPAVLNAADEVAVERFLNEEIALGDIPRTIRAAMDAFKEECSVTPDLEILLDVDKRARAFAKNYGNHTA